MRRMDGYNDLNRSWSQQVSLEFPAVSPDAPVLPSPPLPSRHKKKQGTLTSRRVIRRYQRLVKSSWDNKSFIKHVIKKIKKKRRQRSWRMPNEYSASYILYRQQYFCFNRMHLSSTFVWDAFDVRIFHNEPLYIIWCVRLVRSWRYHT